MKKVEGFEEAQKLVGDFQFHEFPIIRELHFYEVQSGVGCDQKIDLTIESESRTPNWRLKLKFTGVTNLKIDSFGGGQTRVIGLDIIDASQNQWEGIFWRITDFENNVLGFLSRTAEIVSTDKLQK